MKENNKIDWFEHYLALIRAELKDSRVVELLLLRDSTKQKRDNFKSEIIKIENEIDTLQSKESGIINEALALEKKTSEVNEIKSIEAEIASIELYRKKLDYKGEELIRELALMEKALGVAIKRALRKSLIQEQAILDQELEILAKRIEDFTKAGHKAVSEIKGKIDYYFLGSRSDLNINHLLKSLKL